VTVVLTTFLLKMVMTIPALREFILKQGPSKAVTNFDWGLIWATNKKTSLDQLSEFALREESANKVHAGEIPHLHVTHLHGGIRRRGMTIPALREFILKQGPSKAVTNFDWGLIWFLTCLGFSSL
jgi:hypothetical protein